MMDSILKTCPVYPEVIPVSIQRQITDISHTPPFFSEKRADVALWRTNNRYIMQDQDATYLLPATVTTKKEACIFVDNMDTTRSKESKYFTIEMLEPTLSHYKSTFNYVLKYRARSNFNSWVSTWCLDNEQAESYGEKHATLIKELKVG